MADKNRGGRSVGDDFDGDDPIEGADDLDADEFDTDGLDESTDAAAGRGALVNAQPASARARAAARSKTKDDRSVGLLGRIVRFVREVVAELQKVIWPTRKELLTYTTVVVIFVSIMMTFVALLDVGFARAMFLVFGSNTTTP